MKRLRAFLAAMIVGGGIFTFTSLPAVNAASPARSSDLSSSGVLRVVNPTSEEVLIDSADLVYLATEIDKLEDEYTSKLTVAYNTGYTDGQVKKAGPTITHIYHQHVNGNAQVVSGATVYSTTNPGGCYGNGTHTHNMTGTCPTHTERVSDGQCGCTHSQESGTCSVCHHPAHSGSSSSTGDSHGYCHATKYKNSTVYDCSGYANTWELACGKTTSTIIQTILTYYDN